MSYVKQGFTSGQTLMADHLNYIENGVEELDNRTKVVKKEFKKFEVGQTFKGDCIFTKDNVENPNVKSFTYVFECVEELSELVDVRITYEGSEFRISVIIDGQEDDVISGSAAELSGAYGKESYNWELISIEEDEEQGCKLGEYVDKQLTAQEVYEEVKNEFQEVNKTIKKNTEELQQFGYTKIPVKVKLIDEEGVKSIEIDFGDNKIDLTKSPCYLFLGGGDYWELKCTGDVISLIEKSDLGIEFELQSYDLGNLAENYLSFETNDEYVLNFYPNAEAYAYCFVNNVGDFDFSAGL